MDIPSGVDRFFFRDLHPGLHLGTASDRYAGWIGQVYTEDRWSPSSRTKRVGGQSFQERVLPVESVEEYFQHFETLEVDFTFYAPLLDEGLNPSRTFHVLRSYREHLGPDARLILKAPQAVFARKLRRGKGFVDNPDYLNVDLFVRRFYEPARQLLGGHLAGILFEQEYRRKQERAAPEAFAAELDGFFGACPADPDYHLEVRTEAYLSPSLFEMLERRGIGQVLSHWTWLPPLRVQLRKAGSRFFNRGNQCVVRLMTPRGVRYEEAYRRAFPFDRLVEGMLSPDMIEDAVRITTRALREEVRVNMVVNNRAGGNAPLIARGFARSLLRSIAGAAA
jgi:uncharacterized protein YecE (DUF72 family)